MLQSEFKSWFSLLKTTNTFISGMHQIILPPYLDKW